MLVVVWDLGVGVENYVVYEWRIGRLGVGVYVWVGSVDVEFIEIE